MPPINTKQSDTPSPGSASIKDQGCYENIASWRRQQTLTKDQLEPQTNSAPRRKLYKSGKK